MIKRGLQKVLHLHPLISLLQPSSRCYKSLLLFLSCQLSTDYLASFFLKNKRTQEVEIYSFYQLAIVLNCFFHLLEKKHIHISFSVLSSRIVSCSTSTRSCSINLFLSLETSFPYKCAQLSCFLKSHPLILPLLVATILFTSFPTTPNV